jgi:hypothetical protein
MLIWGTYDHVARARIDEECLVVLNGPTTRDLRNSGVDLDKRWLLSRLIGAFSRCCHDSAGQEAGQRTGPYRAVVADWTNRGEVGMSLQWHVISTGPERDLAGRTTNDVTAVMNRALRSGNVVIHFQGGIAYEARV